VKPDAHLCHAPYTGGRVTDVIGATVIPVMNAYLSHHRTCEDCARLYGLNFTEGCTTDDWYAPDTDRLCDEGQRLLSSWQRTMKER
jgi:hypothetical protein